MISVINRDLFTMKRYTMSRSLTGDDAPTFKTLVNLHIDPKTAELRKYEKKAFLSFVFTSDSDPEKLADNVIYDIMQESEVIQHSVYDKNDTEYDKILNMFPSDIRYPTIIFERTSSYTAKNLCVIALPVKGIVTPIRKSDMYKLYNGALIICKIFKHFSPGEQPDLYNKIVYILVDIVTAFSFNEYIETYDTNAQYGLMNTYNYFLLPKSNDLSALMLSSSKTTSLVPLKDRRQDFFTKKEPNIFHLSDIPSGIYIRPDSIMRELRIDRHDDDNMDNRM